MRHRRTSTVVTLLLGASFAVAPLVAGMHAAGAATPAATNRAGVVVDLGNGTVRRVGITFSGTISGVAALQLAGFSPSVRGFGGLGAAVCALEVNHTHYGCPTDATCLTCADPDYWAYSRAVAGSRSFTISRVGAGATQLHDGDIEGWRWGTGDTPAYVPIERFFPPPPTTTTVAATPTTKKPITGTGGTTPHKPTKPPGVTGQQATVPSTTTAKGASTTTRAGATTSAPATTTTGRASTTTASDPTSASTDARAGPDDDGGSRRVASAPPIVKPSSGTSPTGWIAFAVIIAAFGVAIVAVRRSRARPTSS